MEPKPKHSIMVMVGENHRTAPIELRERLSISKEGRAAEIAKLAETLQAEELVVLSTCNRFEIYAVGDATLQERILLWMSGRGGISLEELKQSVYHSQDQEALKHLVRVAAGLDSMVVGEAQIFGQVKEAYQEAMDVKTVGRILGKVFHRTISLVKKVRHQTALDKWPVSVSSIALDRAEERLGSLNDKKVLVLGSGKISALTVKRLSSEGTEFIWIANRTYEKAVELAKEASARAVPWESLQEHLAMADLVIVSTGASSYVVSAEMLEKAAQRRENRLQMVIDLAMPRNVDPAAKRISSVVLEDIQDLNDMALANAQKREKEARRAEEMIEQVLSTQKIFTVANLEPLTQLTAVYN